MVLFGFFVLLAVALAVLIGGAHWFVVGAEKIGLGLGISPYVVGVTIVAMGTSLPEFASSVAAILRDESAIVTGNVVGSNITNILLVLGAVALFGKTIYFEQDVVNVDLPIMIISAFLVVFILRDDVYSLGEGILLVLAFIVFLINTFQSQTKEEVEGLKRDPIRWKSIAFLLLGCAGVYFGAEYTIISIEKLSLSLGVGSDFIALTIVALGTSLPELVVSIQAASRGNPGIAVGNVIGSNIFNICGVLGVSRLVGFVEIPDNISGFGVFFMAVVSLILGILAWSKKITRFEGGMLLVLYGFFIMELSQELNF